MFYKYNALTIIWAVFILILMFLPGSQVPDTDIWIISGLDKIVHFGIFAVLVLLMVVGFSKQYSFWKLKQYPVKYSLILGMIYGTIIEISQGLVPERFVEIEDLIANLFGCIGGTGLFYLIYKI